MHSLHIKWPPSNRAGPSAPLPPRTEGGHGVQVRWGCTAAPVLNAHTNLHIRSVWDPNRKTLKCKAVTESKSQSLPFPDHEPLKGYLELHRLPSEGEKTHTLIYIIPRVEFQRLTDHPLKPIHKVQLKKLPLLWPPWSWLPPQWYQNLEPSHSWSHSY